MAKQRKPQLYSADNPDKQAVIRICELMGEGKSLKKICEMPLMPSWNIVWQWHRHEWVKTQIADARLQGTYYRDDEIGEIAEETMKTMVDVARNKLRIETRERRNARFNPEVFGEKRAAPGGQQPPALPNPEATKLLDDQMAENLKAMEARLASLAKPTKGGPKMINVTPIRKPDIDGKAVRK